MVFTANLKSFTPVATVALIAIWSLGTVSAQQSIVENIRPVGQVCLAGEACAGSSTNSAPVAVSSTVAAPTPEPAAVAPAAVVASTAFDAEATYQMSCFACHSTGAAGAPKTDDKEAWTERLAKGMDEVMANVVNGLNAMPPKGMCFTCSDDDLRVLVDYMVSQ